ncbi:MAG TPA: M17 family peptidase N-terminal domain-containing protein [Verrucomicrobiae bacterium]|nr:M17 family peptidase N-terminal domain-containing protein [Verrucomicrobiae bacterium]
MDIRLVISSLAEAETECLAVVLLDHGDKQKPAPRLAMKDAAVEKVLSELISSGEISGKAFETTLLHRPQGLKAKRLLAIGVGKAGSFSHVELRKAAGTAVRFLKSRMIKSCAFAIPELSTGAEDAVRSIVEGTLVADFDPDTYRSDRKNLAMKDVTVVAPQGSDQS